MRMKGDVKLLVGFGQKREMCSLSVIFLHADIE